MIFLFTFWVCLREALSNLLEKIEKANGTYKHPERVRVGLHEWTGMGGRPHFNDIYLGCITIKTYLRTSQKMVDAVNEFRAGVTTLESLGFIDERTPELVNLLPLLDKIMKYHRQISRRTVLRCFQEWKAQYPDSHNAYMAAEATCSRYNDILIDILKRRGLYYN